MNPERYRWKLQELWVIVFCTAWSCGLGATCLRAQEPRQAANGDTENLCGVVRVSWQLIEAFADEQVTAEIPFESSFSRGTVTGSVESQVKMTIQPRQSESTPCDECAVFLVKAEGNAKGKFVASTGRFRIAGPISIIFGAEREVSFDGRHFTVSEVSVTASVSTRFSTIRTRRNGPLGRAVASIAAPTIRSVRTSIEREASPVARRYVAEFMNQYTTEIVAQLNEVTPIEESLFRLYPEMAEWRIRISTDDDYLEACYSSPGNPRVQLPQTPYKHAGIEIWIRTTAAEAKFLERLGKWKQAQSLLAKYLPKEGSEAGKLTSDTTARSFGPWFALLIGTLPTDSLAETESASRQSPSP